MFKLLSVLTIRAHVDLWHEYVEVCSGVIRPPTDLWGRKGRQEKRNKWKWRRREKKRPWVFLLAEGHPAERWLQAQLDPLLWLDSLTHTHTLTWDVCHPGRTSASFSHTHGWKPTARRLPVSHTPTPTNTPHSQRASCPTQNNPDHVRPSTTHWHCLRCVWWEDECVFVCGRYEPDGVRVKDCSTGGSWES